MKERLRDIQHEKGSTSVLIVILMIVLMAFGMAALTTSYASYRMAEKSRDFVGEHNKLDSNANKTKYDIALIVERLGNSIKRKSQTLDRKAYIEYMNNNVSAELLSYLRDNQEYLIQAAYEMDEVNFTSSKDIRIGTVRYTVFQGSEQPKYLTVKMNIYAPPLLGYTSYKEFIEIVEWYEWQMPVGIVEEQLFDDLFEDENTFDENFFEGNKIQDENP